MFTTDQRLAGLTYDPQNFRDIWDQIAGKALWTFLIRADNVVRMETAAYLERAAVEPLGPILVAEFGAGVEDDRIKQTIGHMTRQVMEALGYEIDRPGLRISREGLFTSGARYRSPDAVRDKAMKITREQRQAWLENTAHSPFNVWLNAQVRNGDGKLDIERLFALAEKYGVEDKREAYKNLNPGQLRMNLGIALRKVVPPSEYDGN